MFDSGVTAKDIVDSIRGTDILPPEVDIAPDIPEATYYTWIDEAEQLLYSEIIREITLWSKTGGIASPFNLSAVTAAGAAPVRFEDIYAVHINDVQLAHVTAVGALFPDTYWKQNNALCFSTQKTSATLKIYYNIRPALKAGSPTQTVKLPVEWLPIIRAKLRGEAFKLVNEDGLAAKWLNDYNVLLEQFKQYMAARTPQFGV